MSREELIDVAIYLTKRIEEEEAAHKNERQIAKLKKQENCLLIWESD